MADVSSYHMHGKPVHHTSTQYTQGTIQPQIISSSSSRQYSQQQMSSSHSHSRTVSSNIFPSPSYTQTTTTTTTHYNRRPPSTATASSTMSSRGGEYPARSPSSASLTLGRSGSTRSGTSFAPTSYVALMRKQKATVWCDRAQLEDPRMAAAAKAAKHRATLEVSGANASRLSTSTSGGTSSLGVRGKITNRYYNPNKPVGNANLLGTTGVPMRLSATEVGDEEKLEADTHSDFRGQRTGSGRSSLQNTQRPVSAITPRQSGRYSTSSTPPSGHSISPPDSTPVSANGTMVNRRRPGASATGAIGSGGAAGDDYFAHPSGNGGSGSSGEEARFGEVGDMEAPKTSTQVGNGIGFEDKTADELSRRGSVDERAATMRGQRLFIANPDLSD